MNNLKDIRLSKKMSVKELAEFSFLTPAKIRAYENGIPKKDLMKISIALGCQDDEIQDNTFKALSYEENSLIEDFRALPSGKQIAVRRFCSDIIFEKKQEKTFLQRNEKMITYIFAAIYFTVINFIFFLILCR